MIFLFLNFTALHHHTENLSALTKKKKEMSNATGSRTNKMLLPNIANLVFLNKTS